MNPDEVPEGVEAVRRAQGAPLFPASVAESLREAIKADASGRTERLFTAEELRNLMTSIPVRRDSPQLFPNELWKDQPSPAGQNPAPGMKAAEEAKRMWEMARKQMQWEPKYPGHNEPGDGGPLGKSRTPTGDELRRLGLVVCADCGAVMADVARHQRWHEEVKGEREGFVMSVRSVRGEFAKTGVRVDELAAEVAKAMALMETVMEAIEAEDD